MYRAKKSLLVLIFSIILLTFASSFSKADNGLFAVIEKVLLPTEVDAQEASLTSKDGILYMTWMEQDKTTTKVMFSMKTKTGWSKATPVHVKAAWIYNDLLKYWGLNNFEQIKSSEKIKWVYLKPNTMNIKQIGFKGYDDPPKIMEFIEQNIDYEKLFTRALEKKIRMFYEALKWDMPVDKANTLERFF